MSVGDVGGGDLPATSAFPDFVRSKAYRFKLEAPADDVFGWHALRGTIDITLEFFGPEWITAMYEGASAFEAVEHNFVNRFAHDILHNYASTYRSTGGAIPPRIGPYDDIPVWLLQAEIAVKSNTADIIMPKLKYVIGGMLGNNKFLCRNVDDGGDVTAATFAAVASRTVITDQTLKV